MKNNRREFLKLSGLAGIGLAGAGIIGGAGQPETKFDKSKIDQPRQTHNQKFNMSGYAAPRLGAVRIGNIGIGGVKLSRIGCAVEIHASNNDPVVYSRRPVERRNGAGLAVVARALNIGDAIVHDDLIDRQFQPPEAGGVVGFVEDAVKRDA